MTICDYPDYLAVGYLLNQNMLKPDDVIEGIDHDEELDVVVVRTARATNYEEKLKKKVRTSGCAQGTAFGHLTEKFETVKLPAAAVLKPSCDRKSVVVENSVSVRVDLGGRRLLIQKTP